VASQFGGGIECGVLQDDMAKNDDPNQYVVHDPLLEKGKEKFNREQAKLKRRNREWAGNSVT
jgi:peptidyl-prolyl cis-trans isomerase SDCCAG10